MGQKDVVFPGLQDPRRDPKRNGRHLVSQEEAQALAGTEAAKGVQALRADWNRIAVAIDAGLKHLESVDASQGQQLGGLAAEVVMILRLGVAKGLWTEAEVVAERAATYAFIQQAQQAQAEAARQAQEDPDGPEAVAPADAEPPTE